MRDIFGKALLDYYQNSFVPPLLLHNEYGPPETIPVDRFFWREDKFPDLELFALKQVHGKILEVGAGTGRHTLYMQNQGHDVSALDISASCGILMKKMGVEKIIIEDIYAYHVNNYDTIIMLMNGIGIAGNINRLKKLLKHLKNLINPEGQLLLDSSDISYLYHGKDVPKDTYFGELKFHYEYRGIHDDPISWLYIDQNTLMGVANSTGWNCQIIFEDETEAFLARLQLK